jgi:hypothetical protein
MRPRGQLQPAIAWATKVETEECVLVPPFAVSWTPGGTAANVIDLSSGRIVRIFRKHKAPILHVTAGDDACFTACADGKALYWTCKDGHVLHAFNAEGSVSAVTCGRRVLAVADSAGVHKVSFHSTVARDTAALEPIDAEVCPLVHVTRMAWDESGKRLAVLQDDGSLSVVTWPEKSQEAPAVSFLNRLHSRRIESLFWLSDAQIGVFQIGEQSSAIAVVDVSEDHPSKARPLRVFDTGTKLLVASPAGRGAPSLLAAEHSPADGILRLSSWNLRTLAAQKPNKARSGSAALMTNCSVALPFLRREPSDTGLPALPDPNSSRGAWQDAFAAAAGISPAKEVSGGVVAPLVFLPRGKGLDLIVRANRSSQLLLLQVKESVARVLPRSSSAAAGPGRTQSAPLEKVAEDQVYHSIDEETTAISVLQDATLEEESEEKPARLSPSGKEQRAIFTPEAPTNLEETAAEAPLQFETQLEVTKNLELEPTQALAAPGPPTVLASSGKGLRKKAPQPPEPLRLRDLKGQKLRALLEAREVLDDAHLLSAQQSGEVRTENILKRRAEKSISLADKSSPTASTSIVEQSKPSKSPTRRRGMPKEPPANWDWNEWKTWSAYSKVWTHHWSRGEVPAPEAPYDTHWLANPYLGHSPYQPWLNNLKPNYPKGLKKASSSPALASLTKGVRRTEIIEPAKPPTGLENYDANVQKLLHSSAKKAARHYVAGMLEDKMRLVLGAMERPAMDPTAAWSYGEEYAQFEKTMELTEELVVRTAKLKPQTVDPDLLRFQSDSSAPDVPLFSHFVPEHQEPAAAARAGGR